MAPCSSQVLVWLRKKINEKNRTQNVKFGAVLKIYTIVQNLR